MSETSNPQADLAKYQISSPKSKAKASKKDNNVNFSASQSQAARNMGQMAVQMNSSNVVERASGMLYQVDTEKLLLSNDKVTITDLWKSNPQPTFPPCFLAKINLEQYQNEAQIKAENLRVKMDKRKLDEKKKEEAKLEKAAK